jgi:5-methylcytosine-specific restriction endonuclease McrA
MDRYKSKEWQEKRDKIIIRDNFTCQNKSCNSLNPSKGMVDIISPINGCIEQHNYSNSHESTYRIISNELTVDIGFAGLWITMPIMQVHHKRYVVGKELWEYDDNDLITLCKDCHTTFHQNHKIDIYDNFGKEIISSQLYNVQDIDLDPNINHNFKPWIFINNSLKEHSSSKVIKAFISRYFIEMESMNNDDILTEADKIEQNFFKTYLPNYIFEVKIITNKPIDLFKK